MKKYTKGIVGLTCLGLLLGGVLLSSQGQADEEKVYIPERDVRSSIINAIQNTSEEIVENETPTLSQIESLDNELYIGGTPELRSLEGLNYAKNVKHLRMESMYGVSDYRPIGQMENLETFFVYPSHSMEETNKLSDINFVKNLTKLKSFTAMGFPVVDLTPFNELPNLEEVRISNSFPSNYTVSVDRSEKSTVIKNPVTYSSQFSQNFVQEITANADVTIDGNNLVIENINELSDAIDLTVHATAGSNGQYSYYLNYTIEINWY